MELDNPCSNLHPKTRNLITLSIIYACWAGLPKLLVVIKLPSCFFKFNHSIWLSDLFGQWISQLTIHVYKALFTSICSEFTASYFFQVSPCPHFIMGTRLKNDVLCNFECFNQGLSKIYQILEYFIRKIEKSTIFHLVSINIFILTMTFIMTCEFNACYTSSFYFFPYC